MVGVGGWTGLGPTPGSPRVQGKLRAACVLQGPITLATKGSFPGQAGIGKLALKRSFSVTHLRVLLPPTGVCSLGTH